MAAAAAEVMEVIETLRKLDDTYSSIEKELRQKVAELRKQYQPKLDAVIADRTTQLTKTNAASADAHSTPAIPGFWLDVLANSEEFNEDIEEYDEPVLEYLDAIEAFDQDPTDEDKGFVVVFKFNENPFFTNTEIRKVYTTARANEFTDQLAIVKIESDKISWKEGQDVTVETVAKKRSGGGKKKKAGVSIQPRPSFFRFFRDLDVDNMPSEFGDEEEEQDYEDEEETMLERLQMFMEHDWDKANTLKELIIPRAIRWYTGEAVQPEDEEEDDEDDEDEDDDEEEESDEDGDDSPAKATKSLFPAGAAKNPEECKQQ